MFNWITKLFGIPLGWVMYFIYKFIPNYGIALLIFTILTRLIMFPMAIKQQKTSAKMAVLQPKINEIQQTYANDPTRMNEEMQALYAEENYNPASGCLPMLVQFPILFGLIDVIYRPLSHILRLPATLLADATRLFGLFGLAPKNPNMVELGIIGAVKKSPLFFGVLGTTTLQSIQSINYTFLGINLMEQPAMSMIPDIFRGHFNPVVLIPIISGVTSLLMSIITMRTNSANTQGQPGAGMMNGMFLTMPIMSIWIAFTVPAGVGLYWVYSNICAILQNLYLNKFHNPQEAREKAQEEQKQKEEAARLERLEARKKAREGKADKKTAVVALTQKEKDRLKLAEARKRDAEKYGDPDPSAGEE